MAEVVDNFVMAKEKQEILGFGIIVDLFSLVLHIFTCSNILKTAEV